MRPLALSALAPAIIVLLAASGCGGKDGDTDDPATGPTTTTDTDEPTTDCPSWFPDEDGDGYGDAAGAVPSCEPITGFVENDADCDDADGAVNPDASEVCDAADVDEDCSGAADDADPNVTGQTEFYADADGDGHGAADAFAVMACDAPAGHATVADDCDDANADAYPGAAVLEDPALCTEDVDGDGFGAEIPTGTADAGADCDDADATLFPGNIEILDDGLDQDCDGADLWAMEDDFELGIPDPAAFANAAGDVVIGTEYVYDGAYSATLGGAGGTMTTITVDSSTCSELSWSYRGKRGPEQPDSGDQLVLQYHDGTNWRDLDVWDGNGSSDATFSLRSGAITAAGAYHQALRLRLVSNGSGAGTDEFHIDDFFVGCTGPDGDGDGQPERFDCDDTDPLHWADCGLCVDTDADGFGTDCDLGADCDDADAAIFPGAGDPLDGLDQNCDGMDGPVLFDTFEAGTTSPQMWDSITGDQGVTTSEVGNGSYSLNVGGGGGEAITHAIDTTSCNNISWRYLGKRGPEEPDDTDEVVLSYDSGAGWVTVDTWVGDGTVDPGFTERVGSLKDAGAYAASVRFRLSWTGSGSGSDDFYLDDLIIGCPADNDADGALLDCDDTDPQHWADCLTCVDADLDGYGATCDLGTDCDDADPLLNPGQLDTLGDGIDDDCSGLDGVGFFDDFELGEPAPGVFYTPDPGVVADVTYVGNGAVSINIPGGSTLTTVAADTSTCGGLAWSYLGKRGPDAPEAGDDLLLEVWDGLDWLTIDTWAGDGTVDAAFVSRGGPILTADVFHPDFQIRLRATGTETDDFFVDDFTLLCDDDADGDGVIDGIDCAPADPLHYGDCGLCVDGDGDGYGLDCDLGDDCDDLDPSVRPGAPDSPGDGVDYNCDGLDGVGIFDDFELGGANPAVWPIVAGDAIPDTTYVGAGTTSMNFGGASSRIESISIDTTGCPALAWSYLGKRGPEAPDSGEGLNLEFYDGIDWVIADRWEGTGSVDAAFSTRTGTIADPTALHGGFKVRLVSNGTSGAFDNFFVDDIRVVCSNGDLDGDGVVSDFDCDDADPNHWSDCGLCVDADGDQFGLDCDLGADCDDADAAVHPGVPDPLDGIDQDCDMLDGPALFDDFENGVPDGTVWSAVSGDVIVDGAYTTSGAWSLTLGGGVGIAETKTLDTSVCSTILWTYDGKRGPEAPDAGDALTLSYWDGVAWVTTDVWEGNGSSDADFSSRWGVIDDPAAFAAGFKVMLESNGSGTGTDEFHIDDFAVGCSEPDNDGDGLPGSLDCDDTDPAHWADCGLCQDLDGDTYGLDCDLGPDCDDADATINPTAADLAVDGIDNDCNLVDGPGLSDDFETGAPKATVWASVSGDAVVGTDYVANGAYSFTLGGGVGIAETVPMNTSTCPLILWTWNGKRGPDTPETADTLTLSWNTGAGWIAQDVWEGGATDPDFSQRWGIITDPAAYAAGFSIRLESAGTGVDFDHFHIDDFAVGCSPPDNDGDGLPGALDCDDTDAAHWADCGLCQDLDGDGFGLDCDLGVDCDDTDAATYFGAPDAYGDGLDTDCSTADGPGLFDDFEAGEPVPWVWDTQSPEVYYDTAYSYSGTTSLRIEGGGTADTVGVDLSACSAVFWTYQGQRGPSDPETGEDMRVLYDVGSSWIEADVLAGGTGDADFGLRWGVISDPAALWSGFRLRFETDGTSTDDWFIDDLFVGCDEGDADADGIPAALDCDDADPNHWSDCGLCVDADLDGYGLDCDLGPDCDDADPLVNPAATDVLGDGIDDDCSGIDGVGVFDDFEGGIIDPYLWASQDGDIGYDTVEVANGAYSLRFGGGSSAETWGFNVSTCTEVFWSYEGKRGPDAPESSEALTLLWHDGIDWVEADAWFGTGSTDADFSLQWGLISDPAALATDFRVRFEADGSTTDDFYVDDLQVVCNPGDGDGDGVPGPVDCDDTDAWHWSDCGVCVDLDGDGYGTDCDLGSDCDDADFGTNPAAVDAFLDGFDQDCDTLDLTVLYDDFETGAASPAAWSLITGEAFIEEVGIDCPSNPAGCGWILRLSGGGNSATTVAWDSTQCTSIGWAFEGRRGPDTPEAGDDLTLEYNAGAGWVTADVWVGGASDPTFATRTGTITAPGAFSPTFQMRLSSTGLSGGFDDYYIDDFRVGCTN